MKQKLESIIVPGFNIESAKVKIAVRFLRKLGKYPDGSEVNIIVKGNAANKIVNLSVAKKSLYETISILCKNAGLKFNVEKDAVVIIE